MVWPAPGLDSVASNTIVWLTSGWDGENLMKAFGKSPVPTVTVSVTLYVDALANVWLMVWPVPEVPSPKFQTKLVMPTGLRHGFVPAQLAVASKMTGDFAKAGVGVKLNLGVGVSAGGRITPGG